MNRERPIGHWLKAADQAITASVDAAQRDNGVTRLEWQVLNTIHGAARTTVEEIGATLRTFTDRPTVDVLLAALRARGWIEEETGPAVRLTDVGRRAHARILERQREIRQQAMNGVTREEYDTTLRVLQRIVANLEPARAEGSHRPEAPSGPSNQA